MGSEGPEVLKFHGILSYWGSLGPRSPGGPKSSGGLRGLAVPRGPGGLGVAGSTKTYFINTLRVLERHLMRSQFVFILTQIVMKDWFFLKKHCPTSLLHRHIDGHHKLTRWRFVIHRGIDGYSWIIVYLSYNVNNKAHYSIYLKGIEFCGY